MTQTLKNLLVLIVFIILLVLGYYLFTQRDDMTLSLTGDGEVSASLLENTQVFIERRAQLESLTLNKAIFSDPAFTSLRSYTTEVPDQPIGRSNIFDDPSPVPTVTPVSIE